MDDQNGFIGILILGVIVLIVGVVALMWLIQNLIPIIVLVVVAIIAKKMLFTGSVGRATGQAIGGASRFASASESYVSSRIRRKVN